MLRPVLKLVASCLAGLSLGYFAFVNIYKDKSPTNSYTLRLRPKALTIAPAGGLQGIIPREELRKVLLFAQPRWRIVKTNNLLHALRLWGVEAEFKGEEQLANPSGTELP